MKLIFTALCRYKSTTLCSLCSMYSVRYKNAYILKQQPNCNKIIIHGMVTSAFFSTKVSYFFKRKKCTNPVVELFLNKGLTNLMPRIELLSFMYCCFNISFPPSENITACNIVHTSSII